MMRIPRKLSLLLFLVAAGCSKSLPPLPPVQAVTDAPADSVDSVLFLIGDAGAALEGMSPVLSKMQLDIEEWSCKVARDSAVAIVFLGDNIYPEGMHPPGHPRRAQDILHLRAQTSTVAGACARRFETSGIFVAGNHDWGQESGVEGLVRVRNMGQYLQELRQETEIHVALLPEAGRLGPAVIDIGSQTRLILLDTAWWLLGPYGPYKLRMQADLLDALETKGKRAVVMAAHHPFNSAGPHGGLGLFWETVGVRYLLSRAGAWLQDLQSLPYTELLSRLREVFTLAGPPLVFAGGHEHSLQVIGATRDVDPRHILVSGSASKVTDVEHVEGMRFRYSGPGYMRLIAWKSGRVDLFVVAAPKEFQHCRPAEITVPLEQCMETGIAAYRTVHSERLR